MAALTTRTAAVATPPVAMGVWEAVCTVEGMVAMVAGLGAAMVVDMGAVMVEAMQAWEVSEIPMAWEAMAQACLDHTAKVVSSLLSLPFHNFEAVCVLLFYNLQNKIAMHFKAGVRSLQQKTANLHLFEC